MHLTSAAEAQPEDARIGSIVEIGRAPPQSRPADRNIAALAAETGVYRSSEHRAKAEGNVRVPGDDYDGYIESHVRRLEALRRAAGIVERINAFTGRSRRITRRRSL